MKHVVPLLAAVLILGAAAPGLAEEAVIGQPAPGFSLPDTHGNVHALSDFKGKTVVLEWTNYDCPFVKKHYNTGNMQSLQKTYTDKGVVWLSINSSAPGKQGNYPAADWNRMIDEKDAAPTAVLLDPDGKVGRLYGARTTPHVFVIAPDGSLVYEGAIDDNRSWDPKTVEGAENYVRQALEAVMAGKPVPTATTAPYGCSVKY